MIPRPTTQLYFAIWLQMVQRSLFEAEFESHLRDRLDLLARPTTKSVRPSKAAIPMVSLGNENGLQAPKTAGDQPPRDVASQDLNQTGTVAIETSTGTIWLSGNALLCSCPDCNAPMSIRVWLELADCWRCTTSMQLSEEQIQAVQQLLQTPQPEPESAPPIIEEVFAEPELEEDEAIVVAPPTDSRHAELDRLTRSSLAAQILRRGFNAVPAWLVSFLLHLILILLLALIMLGRQELPSTITLSTFFNKERKSGGEIRIENPLDMLVDDVMKANDMQLDEAEIRHVLQKAEQDARELVVDKAPLSPLPDLDEVKKNVTTRRDQLHSFAARDPRIRAEIVRREGGTTLTEAAVSRGLRWLASVQNKDGSWSLSRYERHYDEDNRGDAAGTSLALLPFLGAGQTHEFGKYKQTVARGLAWLLQNQKRNGDLRADYPGEAGMYAHGQAAIVLCEALAMTGDQQFREPAQRAIDFIEKAQHIRGGWRYRPGQAGDTSILGWQLMALQSARSPNLGLSVSEDTLKLADLYLDDAALDSRRIPRGSLYKYLPKDDSPKASMTAEALLCRMYLGWKRDDPRMKAGISWLVQKHLPDYDEKNIYYWYYGTQVMHHYGGPAWEEWNNRIREILVTTQNKKGSRAGSWSPRGFQWGSQGGRIYVTSLCVCTLEVYYRHLPLFKQLELDSAE